MRGFVWIFAAALAAAVVSNSRGADEPQPGFGALSAGSMSWLAGAWRGEYERGFYEEHWTAAAAGSMVGMFTWAHDGRTRVHEFCLIEESNDTLELRLHHFGRNMKRWEEQPLVFTLKDQGEKRAVFEERTEAGVKTLTYEVGADGRLKVTLEEPMDGERKKSEFVFEKRGG